MSAQDRHPFVARLPIGRRIPFPAEGIPFWEIFPFEGDLQIKVLEEPVLPEPPRFGEDGPQSCGGCQDPLKNAIWSDDRWRVIHSGGPTGLPVMVLLCPLAHHDLSDLPADLSAELGPMLQRVERAILGLGGIARVHVNKWGDGGAHLHFWLIARPAGMMQLRGTCLPIWDDVIPKAPEQDWRASLSAVAAALAAGGGTAYL
jgi:diadenosine tetraphosphate (Ap4A) HIT family hydrolase